MLNRRIGYLTPGSLFTPVRKRLARSEVCDPISGDPSEPSISRQRRRSLKAQKALGPYIRQGTLGRDGPRPPDADGRNPVVAGVGEATVAHRPRSAPRTQRIGRSVSAGPCPLEVMPGWSAAV